MMKTKSIFYRNYLFVPDLILVSVWTLFVMRYDIAVSWIVMAICLLRIVICFQLRNGTAWALYTATIFGCLYFLNHDDAGFVYPVNSMVYYILYILTDHENVTTGFTGYMYSLYDWQFILWCFWTAWIVWLPIVIGYIQLKRYPRYFRKRIIRFSLGCVVLEILLLWLYLDSDFYYCYYVYSTAMLLPALLPFIKPLCHKRRRDGMLQWVLNNRQVRLYTAFTLLFTGALIIGLRQVHTLKLAGLVLGVPLLYALLCKAFKLHFRQHLSVYVALALSGFLYWAAMDNTQTVTILTLAVAILIDATIAALMVYHNRKSLTAALSFTILTPLILVPFILGLNPYTETESTRTHPYLRNTLARNGLFVTTHNECYGLRDRFGRIVAPVYKWCQLLDEDGDYIALRRLEVTNDTTSPEEVYDVYDLRKRRFIFESDSNAIARKIARIDNNRFSLINPAGKQFATLILAGYDNEKDIRWYNTEVIPYEEEPDKSLDIFLPLYSSAIESERKKCERDASPFTIEYFMYDITGDSIPELWLKTGTCEADYKLEVFGYVNGRLRNLLSKYVGHTEFYVEDGTVNSNTSHMGEGEICIYRYADGIINVDTTPFSSWPMYDTDSITDTEIYEEEEADNTSPLIFMLLE